MTSVRPSHPFRDPLHLSAKRVTSPTNEKRSRARAPRLQVPRCPRVRQQDNRLCSGGRGGQKWRNDRDRIQPRAAQRERPECAKARPRENCQAAALFGCTRTARPSVAGEGAAGHHAERGPSDRRVRKIRSHCPSEVQIRHAPGNTRRFADLPPQAQTVIASGAFQYGFGLDLRTPRFSKAATNRDWPEAIRVLKSFGDAYPTRRMKEAALLEQIR